MEKIVRYQSLYEKVVLTYENINLVTDVTDLAFADSTFFQVFSFKLLRGNPTMVLSRPQTMVLTSHLANSLFGESDPIGKTVRGVDDLDYEVTGIAEEPPRNSHLQFKGLISWSTTMPGVGAMNLEWMNNWITQGITTYVLLKEQMNWKNLEAKLPQFMSSHLPTRVDKYKLYLQPFNELYLQSTDVFGTDMANKGSKEFINIFLIIAGILLFVACINYINISTSKSTRRAREVGMRKTMGAGKKQLILQFIGESFLLTLFSACLAAGLLYFAVPFFNDLVGKSLPIVTLLKAPILFGIVGLVIFVSFTAGLYPAFVISSFKRTDVLKSNTKSKITGHWPRYVLITFQFVISIAMIAGTLLVYNQINFVLSKDLGFDKDHILVVNLTDALVEKKEVFQHEVDAFADVISTSVSRTVLGQGGGTTFIIPEGFKPDEVEVRLFAADGNFQKTFGLEMAAGRFFNPTSSSDSGAWVINEALAKRLKWNDPIDKLIKFNPEDPAKPVIGVLKDFQFSSLYNEVEPLIMWISKRKPSAMSVRFSGNPSKLISQLENKWKEYESRYPFDYYFVDQAFAKAYETDQKLYQTIITFAGLSLVIACLGLYGIVAFTIEQRTKELGIRKVLGASVFSLNLLVNWKFIVMVIAGAAIAIPSIIPFLQNWLQRFTYKISMSAEPFIWSVLITLAVTIFAVSIQAIKVAFINPAESLRNE